MLFPPNNKFSKISVSEFFVNFFQVFSEQIDNYKRKIQVGL